MKLTLMLIILITLSWCFYMGYDFYKRDKEEKELINAWSKALYKKRFGKKKK
jgi:hypothetical protein